jgi:hypothetical protein
LPGSGAATASYTAIASSTRLAMTVTQSAERHAGTRPAVLIMPGVGLSPTMPFIAAGTRPEPAVSVAIATGTQPDATATADPELDPPEIRSPP